MTSVTLLPRYILWHYTKAFGNIYGIWLNFVWFIYHFFSISILTKTLFSPWHKMGESYKKGFDVEAFFSTIIVNALMRIVGAVIRLAVIIVGVATVVLVVVGGIVFFLIWAVIPLLILFFLAKTVLSFR